MQPPVRSLCERNAPHLQVPARRQHKHLRPPILRLPDFVQFVIPFHELSRPALQRPSPRDLQLLRPVGHNQRARHGSHPVRVRRTDGSSQVVLTPQACQQLRIIRQMEIDSALQLQRPYQIFLSTPHQYLRPSGVSSSLIDSPLYPGLSSTLPSPTAPYFATSNTRVDGPAGFTGRTTAAPAQAAAAFKRSRLESPNPARFPLIQFPTDAQGRSEEHTSELQSLR